MKIFIICSKAFYDRIPEIKNYLNAVIDTNVSIDEQSDIFEASGANLYDLKQLGKRFEGFEAPSYSDNNEIVSGIDRISPITAPISSAKTYCRI